MASDLSIFGYFLPGTSTNRTKQRICQRGDLDVPRRSSLIQVKAVWQSSGTQAQSGEGAPNSEEYSQNPAFPNPLFCPSTSTYELAVKKKKKRKRDEGFWSSGWRVWLEPIDFHVSDPCFPIFFFSRP